MTACLSWQHAPGFAERESMAKEQWPRILGTLGFRSPRGDVRVSDVNMSSRRSWFVQQTSNATARRVFNVDFGAARAECLAPEQDSPKAFSCAIAMGSPSERTWTLEVGRGCTAGAVWEAVAATGARRERYTARTDAHRFAGSVQPSREVALLDEQGVVAFTDSPGGDLFVHTRRGTTLGTLEVLAIVALQTYAYTMQPGQCYGR